MPSRRKTTSAAPVAELSAQDKTKVRRGLLAWFRKNKRSLPWRNAPTPYGVWVSEIMLQQTRVEVVRDYYSRWMKAYPRVEDLAASDEDDVLRLWQGLGYYSRARRLREGAAYVVNELDGELPSDPQGLLEIPGIGPYSAGAISSIAFGRPSAIVDGNVIRVLTRLFALSGDPSKAPLKQLLWDYAGQLVPAKDASDFNQGLMEFGATVCTPKSPACHACPLRPSCQAFQKGEATAYPQLPKKKKPTPLTMVVVLPRNRGSYLVKKLPPDARWWAGLETFPFGDVEKNQHPEDAARGLCRAWGPDLRPELTVLEPITHTVTRFKVTLFPVVAEFSRRPSAGEGARWVAAKRVFELALPAPHMKAVKLVAG